MNTRLLTGHLFGLNTHAATPDSSVGIRTVPAHSCPNKPVRVIVAFAAGGFADTIAQQISQELNKQIGQNFVLDNRGGAGGNLAAAMVAQAAPDIGDSRPSGLPSALSLKSTGIESLWKLTLHISMQATG